MADEELLYQIKIDQKALLKQLDKVEKNFNDTFSDIDKSASNMDLMGSILGADAIKSGLSTAKDLIVDGLTKIVEETGQLETATVKWGELLGSAESADLKIKEVFAFSDKTPFTFKGVDEASQMLYKLSNGALSSMEDITLLGDASAKGGVKINELSVTWGRLYQKLNAGDKAFAEEINRMNELGIITGETKAELQGMNSELLKAKGWETFANGAKSAEGYMDKLSSTIGGKLSTLEATWDGIFAFDDEEVQQGIKDSVDLLTNTLKDNKPQIQAVLKDVFGVVTDILTSSLEQTIAIWRALNPIKAIKLDNQMYKTKTLKGLENQNKGQSKDVLFSRLSDIESTYDLTKAQIESDLVLTGYKSVEDFLADYKYSGDKQSTELKKIATFFEKFQATTLRKQSLENTISDIYNNQKIIKNGGIPEPTTGTTGTTGSAPISYGDLGSVSDNSSFLYGAYDINQTSPLNNAMDNVPNYETVLPSYDEYFNTSTSSTKKEDEDPTTEMYLNGMTTMVTSTESAMLSMDSTLKAWRADETKTTSEHFQLIATITRQGLQGVSGVASGIEATTGNSLGALIPGLNLASAGFGLASSLFSIFGSDGDDGDDEVYDGTQTQTADIVSTAVDTIIVNANMSVYTTYVDEAGFDQMFSEEIAPRFAELVQGVY